MPITNQQLSRILSSSASLPLVKPLASVEEHLRFEEPEAAVAIGAKRAIISSIQAFWLTIENDPSKSYQQNLHTQPYKLYIELAKLLATDEEVIQENLSPSLSAEMQMILSALNEEERQLLVQQNVSVKSYLHLLMPSVENSTDLYAENLNIYRLDELFYVDKHLYSLADLLQTFQMQQGFFMPHDAKQLLPLELVLQCDKIMQTAVYDGLESAVLKIIAERLKQIKAISIYRLECLIIELELACQAHNQDQLQAGGFAWANFVNAFASDERYRALDNMSVNSDGLTIGAVFARQQASFSDFDAAQQDLECLATNAGLISKTLLGLKHLKEFSHKKNRVANYSRDDRQRRHSGSRACYFAANYCVRGDRDAQSHRSVRKDQHRPVRRTRNGFKM